MTFDTNERVDKFEYVRSYSRIENVLRENSLQSAHRSYENLCKICSFRRILANRQEHIQGHWDFLQDKK